MTADRSRIVQVVVWLLFLCAVVGVCARLGTRWAMTRKVFLDDVLIIVAQIFYLAQGVAVSFAASKGLGDPNDSLTGDQITNVLKAEYTATPLLILTLAIIKLSMSVCVDKLTPNAIHRNFNKALQIVVGLWLLYGVVVSFFQCQLPTPWEYINNNGCIDREAWWASVALLNCITEIGIVGLFVWVIGTLQLPLMKRIMILLVFISRLTVAGAAVTQLIFYRNTFHSSDFSEALYLPTMLNQVVVSLSVITACIPYLQPLMASLESGIVRVPDEPEELSILPDSQRSTQLKASRFSSHHRSQ